MMKYIAEEAEHIYLGLGATDFRKQQNGLAALISLKFKLNPYCGKGVFGFSEMFEITTDLDNIIPIII